MPVNLQTPIRGEEFVFYVCLVKQSDTKLFQANPTLAAGDVKVSKDGGAAANLATLPTVTPASGVRVKVVLSAAEMEADDVSVTFSDAAGAEWCDLHVDVKPYGDWIRRLVDMCQFGWDGTLAAIRADVQDYRAGLRFQPVDAHKPDWSISGSTETVKHPDESTAYTKTLSSAAANPIIGSATP